MTSKGAVDHEVDEAAIQADYLENALTWAELMEKYGIGRRKLGYILKAGGVRLRSERAVSNEESAETVRGLMELVDYQHQRLQKLERELAAERRAASARAGSKPKPKRKTG